MITLRALFWSYCETGSHLLSRERLTCLLHDFVQITAVVKEMPQFADIQPAVESCMEGVSFNFQIAEMNFSLINDGRQSLYHLYTYYCYEWCRIYIINISFLIL